MDKQQVIDLLEFYPRIGEEIKMYANILHDCENEWGISAQQLDGMPHGSGVSDPTARQAYYMAINGAGDYMREIEAQISKLQTLRKEIFNEFKRLPYYQKMVIYYYYLDGKRWAWISSNLNYSERQCKYIRDKAIDSLCEVFEINPNIQPIENSQEYAV